MISGAGPLPWFLPGAAISLVVSLAVSGRVGRALGIRWAVACVMILALGVIFSVTLTPVRWAFDAGVSGARSCDLSRIGLAPLAEYLALNDSAGNVLMIAPLGVAIGLVPRSRRKAAMVASAILLPFAIETIQLLVPWLDRACESADVVDNLTGLVLGLAAGAMAGWLLAMRETRGGAG